MVSLHEQINPEEKPLQTVRSSAFISITTFSAAEASNDVRALTGDWLCCAETK
jgi:hypothetical protein